MLQLFAAVILLADVGITKLSAQAILDHVLANRPTKDFVLKARVFAARDSDPSALEILMKNSAQDTRTIYRSGTNEFLIIQPVAGSATVFQRGTGDLSIAQQTNSLAGSNFSLYDLTLPFLRWHDSKLLGEDRIRGRDCYAIEVRATGAPYARAKLWIDKEYAGQLRAELFDPNDRLVKRFAVTSFKRIDTVWVPRGLEMSFVPAGQVLPAEEKSRIEIFEGNYDAKLDENLFTPARFAAGKP